jgi:hypothetical protein
MTPVSTLLSLSTWTVWNPYHHWATRSIVTLAITEVHVLCMDSHHHQGKTDNRFWFRCVRGYQKRTELCATTYLRQCTFSHIADAITEWLSSKSGVAPVYSFTFLPLPSEWLVVLWYRSHFFIFMIFIFMTPFLQTPHFISPQVKWGFLLVV